MKVGDYVRTKYGIAKIENISPNEYDKKHDYVELDEFVFNGLDAQGFFTTNEIIKSSPNIIDLIEEGDILKLLDVQYDKEYKAEVILDYNDNLCVIDFENNKIIDLKESLFKKNIKLLSILTKEQFESMEYKVGE